MAAKGGSYAAALGGGANKSQTTTAAAAGGTGSGATHKSLKPLAQFAPAAAASTAAAPKKKTTNNKPKAWVSGKGGAPGEELRFGVKAALDENDPNYDPNDDAAPPASYNNKYEDDDGEEYEPARANVESQKQFVASIGDLDKFKAAVKIAADEFLASADAAEFEQTVKDLRMPIYHQELAHIVIKHTLDKKDDERRKITNLLLHCFKTQLVTDNQYLLSFTKLYNQLDDLVVDSPNARKVVAEHAQRAADFGFLNAAAAKRLSDGDVVLHSDDSKGVAKLKDQLKGVVSEYLLGGDMAGAATAFSDLKVAPAFQFEFIKKLISGALDQSDRHRELASLLLAHVSGDIIGQDQVVKAFEILLQRVEDLFLDVRNVLHLLACFLARAVVDEAVPPAFLLRQDLAVSDMGYRVVKEASELLKGKGVAKRLENVWKSEAKSAAAANSGAAVASAAAASTAAAPKPVPQPATGTTGTAQIITGTGNKKAVLSLKPLPKAKK